MTVSKTDPDALPGAWSPDGRKLAISVQETPDRWGIRLVDITSGTARRIEIGASRLEVRAWTQAGSLIVATWPTADTEKPDWLHVPLTDPTDQTPITTLAGLSEDLSYREPSGGNIAARPPAVRATLPPGAKLVDIGGRKLLLDCKGRGQPTVVLDAPLGADSSTWIATQRLLARHYRTCRYDRAGLGLSDPGPLPRTAAGGVVDLTALLKAARINGPIVLVGASFGGQIAQLAAFTSPKAFAGLVLVDAVHPDLDREIEPILGERGASDRRAELGANPEGVRYADLLASDDQVRASRRRLVMPVAVLRHGLPFTGGPDFPSAQVEELWTRLQADLATLSATSRAYLAKRSHHRIAESQPDLVARAVTWTIEHARSS